MHKRITSALAVFAVAALAACSSPAAEPTAAPTDGGSTDSAQESKGTITVGGTGVSFPYSFMDGDELVGFETEVITEAADRAGYEVEFETMEFPGLLGALSAGKIDTTATNLTWTEDRSKTYVFSIAYAFDGVGLSAHADNDEINEIEDLYGKTIATGAGTTNEAAVNAWIEETQNGAQVRSYDNAQSAMQDVLVRRADGLAGPRGSTVAQIEFRDLELKPIGGLLTFEQTRFPFADTERGHQLAEDISASLEEMLSDGSLTTISEKYFGYDRTQRDENFNDPEPTELTLPSGN